MTVRDLTILGCSSQQPTRKRNHSGYLVRWHEEGFLFDPGEGTQRQFIFANIAPTCITRIFISHFHGDHCLGVGSMLMRLNLDKVSHPIHCYYPAEGKVYFDRLRYGTAYHEHIKVVEHPIFKPGIVEEGSQFRIEAFQLDHGIENLAFRITEKETIKFEKQRLQELGIQGKMVTLLKEEGKIQINGREIFLEEVSFKRRGDVFAIVIDTLPCQGALDAAHEATLLLCESTYLERHVHLAKKYRHMTAQQAAELAKKANVQNLVLTHFSARYQDLDEFEKEAKLVFQKSAVAEDLKVFPFPKQPSAP